MNLADVLDRYPRAVAFTSDGTRSPAVITTALNRFFVTEVRPGSGGRRDYSEADVRQFFAYQVVRRGLIRLLGKPERFTGTTNPTILAQLRDQTEYGMPDRLWIAAADVELTVNVPYVLVAELNAPVAERVA